MICFKLRAIALALTLVGSVSAAQAAPATYNFTAEVNWMIASNNGIFENVSADLAGHHLALGDKLVGSLTYDAANAEFQADLDPNNAPGTNRMCSQRRI